MASSLKMRHNTKSPNTMPYARRPFSLRAAKAKIKLAFEATALDELEKVYDLGNTLPFPCLDDELDCSTALYKACVKGDDDVFYEKDAAYTVQVAEAYHALLIPHLPNVIAARKVANVFDDQSGKANVGQIIVVFPEVQGTIAQLLQTGTDMSTVDVFAFYFKIMQTLKSVHALGFYFDTPPIEHFKFCRNAVSLDSTACNWIANVERWGIMLSSFKGLYCNRGVGISPRIKVQRIRSNIISIGNELVGLVATEDQDEIHEELCAIHKRVGATSASVCAFYRELEAAKVKFSIVC